MLEDTVLSRLAQTNTHPHHTLSLYMALDGTREARMLALGDLIKKNEQQLSHNGSRAIWHKMEADRKKIARFIEELPMNPGRGVVAFTCQGMDMFEAFTMDIPVENVLEVGPKPYIRPLAEMALDHQRTTTVLLDKKRARFFESHMGTMTELEDCMVTGDEAFYERDGGQGRTGDSQISRWEGESAHRYYKYVASEARRLCEEKGCQSLAVGGSKGVVEELTGVLQPPLADMLGAVFTLDAGASLAKVAAAVEEASAKERQERQVGLLATLEDNLGPNGKAAAGLNQVLATLYESQVHTLLVDRLFRHAGGMCTSCGRLRHVAGKCPLCGQEMTPVADVVNLAVAGALHSGARVEVLDMPGALDRVGGMAALLRFV